MFLQGEVIVATPDILVFPNIAMNTIFHVHGQEQISLTYELFLPERLPGGATMYK